METVIQEYYKDNAKKLHGKVDKILRKYGGLSDKDRDDFYSLANEVFTISIRDFDSSKCNFDGFLYSNLVKKIITGIRDRNRGKRSNTRLKKDDNGNIVTDENGKAVYEFLPDVSLDAPTGGDEECGYIEDILADDFDLEQKVIEEKREIYSDKMNTYLERLSGVQRKILELMTIGYIGSEIVEELHISTKEYSNAVAGIKSYRNVSILL